MAEDLELKDFVKDVKRGLKKIYSCGVAAHGKIDEKTNKYIPEWMQAAANSKAGRSARRFMRGVAVGTVTLAMTKLAPESISGAAIFYGGAAASLASFGHAWREVHNTGLGKKFRAACQKMKKNTVQKTTQFTQMLYRNMGR